MDNHTAQMAGTPDLNPGANPACHDKPAGQKLNKIAQAQRDREFLRSILRQWHLKQACAQRDMEVSAFIRRRTSWPKSSPVVKAAYSSLPEIIAGAKAFFFTLIVRRSKWESLASRPMGRMAALRKEIYEKLDRVVDTPEFWISVVYHRTSINGVAQQITGIGGCLWLNEDDKSAAANVLASIAAYGRSKPMLNMDHPGNRFQLVSMLTRDAEKAWALERRWAFASTANLTKRARSIYEDSSRIDEVARGLLSSGPHEK
jgi:hypothetical protein